MLILILALYLLFRFHTDIRGLSLDAGAPRRFSLIVLNRFLVDFPFAFRCHADIQDASLDAEAPP
jgi:hypothetical protein